MKLNEWDYDGACKPGSWMAGDTYSIGIFQWVRSSTRSSDKCITLKRSPVRFRIKGYTAHADLAIRAAKAVCERLNSGKPYEWFEKKSATVKTEDDVWRLVNQLNGPPW